jgi:hypothetical protein
VSLLQVQSSPSPALTSTPVPVPVPVRIPVPVPVFVPAPAVLIAASSIVPDRVRAAERISDVHDSKSEFKQTAPSFMPRNAECLVDFGTHTNCFFRSHHLRAFTVGIVPKEPLYDL